MLHPDFFFGPLLSWHTAVLLLFMAVLLSIRTGRLRYDRSRRARERRHLRVALLAELRALRTVLRLNAHEGFGGRLPAQPFWSIYRGNLGRLSLLPEAELAAVVRAHAAAAALDSAAGVPVRVRGGNGRPVGQRAEINLDRLARAARGNVEIAIRALEQGTAKDVPLQRRGWFG